jgi:hypothetical protein
MSERLGFALVLLVAIASVASLLFMSGTSPTANVVAGQAERGINADLCISVKCMGRNTAEPMLNAKGFPLLKDDGTVVCVCPFE